jgi:glycogen debranching enzyme
MAHTTDPNARSEAPRRRTILDGCAFCISDECGDIGSLETSGFFDEDVRFLSRLVVSVNGEQPLLLASKVVNHLSSAFYLRCAAGSADPNALLVARERLVGAGMEERILVRNETSDALQVELQLDLACDFADIMTVKDRDFTLGRPDEAAALPPEVPPTFDGQRNQLVFRAPDDAGTFTRVTLSRPGAVDGAQIRYAVELAARSEWRVTLYVQPSTFAFEGETEPDAEQRVEQRFGREQARANESLAAWQLRVPQLRSGWPTLRRVFEQSASDIMALRLRGDRSLGELPAAGMPWFMTLFGRDTIITCLQTMLFGPELGRAALHALAALQAERDDPDIDAEPGKMVHEIRHRAAARVWFPRYYGTIDATPLYLILLSEVWRWTADETLVRSLREPALRALEWIDRYGDRDGDGFIEYERRVQRGLLNQSWKDSGDSQRFADGRFARTPIAPCEAQGYVYDAKRRVAELARAVWHDRDLADRLDEEAEALAARFDRAYWIAERGGYYALALDGAKEPVDALCSNIGHLLWSGIVRPERVDRVVDQLFGDALWSGWGVRTMSTADAAYNPLAYHNGSVWPHDNSLVAAGLARYGRWTELQLLGRTMYEAASQFGDALPEVFAGADRGGTAFPIPYPTPGRPQAWAAGSAVLLLTLLLGLRPDPLSESLESVAPARLPSWLRDVRLFGVRAFERRWDVQVAGGAVQVVDRGT